MSTLTDQQSVDRRFAAVYKALSCAAVMSVFLPAVHAVFFGALGLHSFFTLLFTALAFLSGYGLTELYARVTKLGRRENDLSYEGLIRYFNGRAAMLPMIAAGLMSLGVYAIVSAYVRWRYENGIDIYWDPNSLWPLLGTALFIAASYAGIVMWFYPYYRICSTKYFVWLLAFLLIDAFISRDQGFVIFCSFSYIVLSMLVLNQNNLILSVIAADSATRGRSASDSDVAPDRLLGRVTVGMRLYNMALIAVLTLLLGGVLLVCVSAVVGIFTLLRMLGYVILAAIFRDPEEYAGEAEEIAQTTYKAVFEPTIYGMRTHEETETFFWIFVAIAIFALFMVFLIAKTGAVKKLLAFLRSLYEAIVRFFSAIFGRGQEREIERPAETSGYVDSESDIDPYELKRMRESETLTFRGFLRELSSKKTASERFSYAYAVMAELLSKNGSGIRRSDTPREIREKLADRDDMGDIGGMTDMYERINYAGKTPPDESAERLAAGAAAVVRRMIGDK